MQFNTYTSSGAHIAAALVNDPMADAAAVGALLAGFDVEEPTPTETELAELRRRYALLTPREREVLPFVVAGLLNKQTAGELGTSEITIQVHRGQIMRKMAASSTPA